MGKILKGNVRYITILLSILFIAVISLANMQEVTVNLLLIHFRLPLILLILLSLLVGALMSILIGGLKTRKTEEKTNEELAEIDVNHTEQ